VLQKARRSQKPASFIFKKEGRLQHFISLDRDMLKGTQTCTVLNEDYSGLLLAENILGNRPCCRKCQFRRKMVMLYHKHNSGNRIACLVFVELTLHKIRTTTQS
jgi:hypothetical protein